MNRLTTIELHKENMKFSAGHFTIWNETQREPMHGHNYNVWAALTTIVNHNGLTFDYRYYKRLILQVCKELNQTFLLPTESPYLTIEEHDDFYHAIFNDKPIPFLKTDVTLLPLKNITVEELSQWFIKKLTIENPEIDNHSLQDILIKVYSGPGQSGSASWKRDHE